MNDPPSASHTAGLNSIDRDRAASMADEGGASAVVVEAEDAPPSLPRRENRVSPAGLALAAVAGAALLYALLRRRY
jgi:hypothetical protein